MCIVTAQNDTSSPLNHRVSEYLLGLGGSELLDPELLPSPEVAG